MFKTYAGAMGQFFTSAFRGHDTDNGLVRMFRVEFPKEYANARRFGARVDEKFVKTYLTENSYYFKHN